MSPPTRVVWIEIPICKKNLLHKLCHHPHGWCGLKSKIRWIFSFCNLSPPTRVVWIEIRYVVCYLHIRVASPPTRVVWIEILVDTNIIVPSFRHHPHGWCGLKSLLKIAKCMGLKLSPPTRVVWIEIVSC